MRRDIVRKIQEYSQNINWSEINLFTSITLKIASICLILFIGFSLSSLKSQFSHVGPDCHANKHEFEYWLNDGAKNDYELLSSYPNRVQLKNGTSNCHGNYINKKGEYKSWSGNITLLDDGSIIGNAN